jgi:hypothetical protein
MIKFHYKLMIVDEALIQVVQPVNHFIHSIKYFDETTFPCFDSLRFLSHVSDNEDRGYQTNAYPTINQMNANRLESSWPSNERDRLGGSNWCRSAEAKSSDKIESRVCCRRNQPIAMKET